MLAFLRLVTNPRMFEYPEPIGDAWQQVNAWLGCETALIPQPTKRHAEGLPASHMPISVVWISV
jgi:hypothetical protein